jgi:hypothetical protein
MMALPPRKPKPKPPVDDFAALLEEEPGEEFAAEDDAGFDEPMEDDEFSMEEDPMMAEADDMGASIDPEMASLAQTLGFTEPEQQQALIDLIKLVNTTGEAPMPRMGDDLESVM